MLIRIAGLALLAALAEGAALRSRIDSIFSPLAGARTPGMAVLVRQNGHTLLERGYGVREMRTGAPIDAHTDFRLASCTKQFTAMAIMLLVHDGRLRYDDKLTELFPEFPAYGRAITIRDLLTHTSGLPDYEDLMEKGAWSAGHQIQDREVLESLERQTAGKFAPGTGWAYSNSGYVLLGLIVARVSGEPFGRFLDERIFGPLHMTGTVAYVKGENDVPNRAFGHTRGPDGFIERDQSATSATLGDGGVYSNVADLARWDEALAKNELLSREEMSAALAPVRLADGGQPRWPREPGEDNLSPGEPVAYGFGWFVDAWRGRRRMWHFGSTMGFRTAIMRFPADRVTIVVLCNRTDLDSAKLARQAAEAVLP